MSSVLDIQPSSLLCTGASTWSINAASASQASHTQAKTNQSEAQMTLHHSQQETFPCSPVSVGPCGPLGVLDSSSADAVETHRVVHLELTSRVQSGGAGWRFPATLKISYPGSTTQRHGWGPRRGRRQLRPPDLQNQNLTYFTLHCVMHFRARTRHGGSLLCLNLLLIG
ncbi:hypothetical protein F5Y16DRAFT_29833 [Xylariaceae sp. FL0255]|nr:hypothetical protein F5Y16DRAFT_29833 [Xylariaceae sp. FL0255]